VSSRNVAFFASNDGCLYALRGDAQEGGALRGSLLWKCVLSRQDGEGGKTTHLHSSPALNNEETLVFIGTASGDVLAISAANGYPVWVCGGEGCGSVFSSIVVSPSLSCLYYGTDGGFVRCVDASTGRVNWQCAQLDDAVRSSPCLSSDAAKIFVGLLNGTFIALSAFTGEAVWTFVANGPIHSSPSVWEGLGWGSDVVCFGSDDGVFYCLSCQDGSVSWSFATGGAIRSSPAIFSARDQLCFVAFASMDGCMYALSLGTGSFLSSACHL